MNSNGFSLIRLVPLATLVLCALPGGARGETPAELLRRLEKQRTRVRTLHMITKTTTRRGDTTRVSTAHTWEKRDGKVRKTRVKSQTSTVTKDRKARKSESAPTLTVCDGRHEWRQTLVGDSVMVFKSKPTSNDEFGKLLAKARNGKAAIKGSEIILGQPCVVLEVRLARRGDRSKSTYWISKAHGLILKSIITRAGRGRTEKTTTELHVNEPIADEQFVFTPPPGAAVVDTEAFGVKRPGAALP